MAEQRPAMIFPPMLAFILWVPVALFFFRRYPIRVAILLNFLGGWAILPAAHFLASEDPQPYTILGDSLATNYFFTKATVTGFTGLLCVFLFDRKIFRRFRLTFWDLPMAMWCMVPLLSTIANPGDVGHGLQDEIYQLLSWGVPYVLGRLYFSDTASLRLAAKAFVIAGLLYVPICLVEIYYGPQFYAHLYGFQPLRWVRVKRYFGYRPIGFLENGTQLGIWMATAALLSVWLWLRHTFERILGLPTALVAIILCVTTILCQSTGSIVLLFALLPLVFISRKYFPRVCAIVLVVGILSFASLRLLNIVSLSETVHHNAAAHDVSAFLKKIGRGSLGTRLARDERTVSLALEQPLLGSNQWDWWSHLQMRPAGLWLLTFGMYGLFGLLALEAMQLIPVVRVAWFPIARSDIEDLNLRHAFVGVILMTAIDNLLNSAMILPLMLVIGGMSTWEAAAREVRVEVEIPEEMDYLPQLQAGDVLDVQEDWSTEVSSKAPVLDGKTMRPRPPAVVHAMDGSRIPPAEEELRETERARQSQDF